MSKNGTPTGPAVAVAQSAWRRGGALSHISGSRGCGKCGKCGGKGYASPQIDSVVYPYVVGVERCVSEHNLPQK